MSEHQQPNPARQVEELRHKIDISEGEILLRQTGDADLRKSGRKSLAVPQKKVQRREEDAISRASTTSEVRSEDDAASIASRLSQIAVEEEERLCVNSAANYSGDEAKSANDAKRNYARQELTSCLPEILVIADDGRRQSAPMVVPGELGFHTAAHQPERGNLRQLEHARSPSVGMVTAGMRSRSNTTAGSMMLESDGQLILNIRRSAWTLSQFDETFNNKELANQDSESNISSLNELDTAGSRNDQSRSSLRAFSDKQAGNKLLITASKNALNLAQGTQLTSISMDNRTFLTQRRLSHCNSLVSVASSLESLYTGKRRTSLPLGDNHRRPAEGGTNLDESMMDKCCRFSTLSRCIPILEWLPRYKMEDFWGDLTAGIAVAVLNISTSLSAAVVAETELSVAFRSSIINTFVFALLCSSRHTSFGSWSLMSQLLVVSVRKALSDELILNRINLGPSAYWEPEEYDMWHMNIIIMYTFLIGLVQLICGLLNLGNLFASFIPEALCSSMIAAAAFTMAIGQLANMCGTSNKILFSIERNTTALWADLKNPPVDITDFFAGSFRWIQQIVLLIKYYDQINIACVIISIISVILLYLNQVFIQKQLTKLFKRDVPVPFEMIILVIAILASYWMDLEKTYQVQTCGSISINFPTPSIPDLRLVRELWSDSIATALISYTMVYIMAKTYGNKFNYDVDCNQELIACGAGNLVGGLFDALPATGSFSRTAGQVEAGGRTQMASIFNCIILYALAQLLGHHVTFLPICVMSAALFFTFVRMMARVSEVFIYWRICKVDFAIWIVTFVCILAVDMVNGFLYGLIFSILTMLYRAQNRRCYLLGTVGSSDVYVPLVKYPLAQEIEGIKIFQFCGPIHYVCAELFERLLRQKTRVSVKEVLRDIGECGPNDRAEFNPRDMNLPSHIILDFSMISYVDSAGIHLIKKLIEDYRRINVTIYIASLASHVASMVKSEPSLWGVYKERFYVTLADAVYCAVRDGHKGSPGNTFQVKV